MSQPHPVPPTRDVDLTARTGHARRRAAAAVALAAGAVAVLASPAAAAVLTRSAATAAGESLTWLKAAVLGVVEGITEFLPVSSTGHLVVASRLMGLPSRKGSAGLDAINTYTIAIQFGAIVAVAGVFWKRFVQMIEGLFGRDAEGRHLLWCLLVAFAPAAVLGAAFDSKIEEVLFGPWPVVVAWILGGVAILALSGVLGGLSGDAPAPRDGAVFAPLRVVGMGPPPVGATGVGAITVGQALLVGVAQCVALWPGISRSLATILGALAVGMSMSVAVEFSFLLGFGTLTAATLFKLVKDGSNMVDVFGVGRPGLGAVVAFVSAVAAVKWMIGYLQRHDLKVFAYYRIGIAIVTVGLLAAGTI
ncbi:MAG: undecaprenyl-diphosphate phosphatase [Microthrixaceae bacterium]